jgi:hypothetical protein
MLFFFLALCDAFFFLALCDAFFLCGAVPLWLCVMLFFSVALWR